MRRPFFLAKDTKEERIVGKALSKPDIAGTEITKA